ncbi:hypothetical protein HaLaN_07161, partial [Haematococcus lacustris]
MKFPIPRRRSTMKLANLLLTAGTAPDGTQAFASAPSPEPPIHAPSFSATHPIPSHVRLASISSPSRAPAYDVPTTASNPLSRAPYQQQFQSPVVGAAAAAEVFRDHGHGAVPSCGLAQLLRHYMKPEMRALAPAMTAECARCLLYSPLQDFSSLTTLSASELFPALDIFHADLTQAMAALLRVDPSKVTLQASCKLSPASALAWQIGSPIMLPVMLFSQDYWAGQPRLVVGGGPSAGQIVPTLVSMLVSQEPVATQEGNASGNQDQSSQGRRLLQRDAVQAAILALRTGCRKALAENSPWFFPRYGGGR